MSRFTQPDTIVPSMNSQAMNRYSYNINNPIINIDPSGHGYCDTIYADSQNSNGIQVLGSNSENLGASGGGVATGIEGSFNIGCGVNVTSCESYNVSNENIVDLCEVSPWYGGCGNLEESNSNQMDNSQNYSINNDLNNENDSTFMEGIPVWIIEKMGEECEGLMFFLTQLQYLLLEVC